MKLIEKLFECLEGDRFSSEYVKDERLCLCAGTPDRLTAEKLEKRISASAERAGIESASAKILAGYEELEKQYRQREKAEGTVLLKLNSANVEDVSEIKLGIYVKEVIFDHDLGSDCDDGGAAAMLIKAHRDGICKVLAITGCVYNHYASACVGAMCEYFGVSDIDIGVNRDRDTLSDPCWQRCSYGAAESYYTKRGREYPEYESNVALIRRKLAQSHGDVTVISTGALTTLYALMQSSPDSSSELDGTALFREKVGHYVCGGGKFPDGTSENNFLCDPEAVNVCVNEYLKGFPITFVGAEVAGIVFSGSVMKKEEYSDYILRRVYEYWRPDDCNHNSWDLGVMHYALYGITYGYFEVKKGYTVRPYGERGEMELSEGGIHEYVVRKASVEELSAVFNEHIVP